MRFRLIEPILRRALRGDCALPRGTRVLVGVSGGADSTALLIALHSLAPEFGLELHAAHLHHGLRGRDADRDLESVVVLCERLGVPLTRAVWDTRRRMKNRGLSGQAGLRTLRREFLIDAAKRAGAHVIATAHTADDQLETLIMRLLRGSSLAGLAGMRPRRGRWIKPLLEATRHEIAADLLKHRVVWREDLSNADPRYLRSRTRHGVIPALIAAHLAGAALDAEASSRFRAQLARHAADAAREIREAYEALRSNARRLLTRGDPSPAPTLRLAMFRDASPALRRAALRECWRRASPLGPGLTRAHVDALLRLMARGGGAQGVVELPAGRRAELRHGRLSFSPAAPPHRRSRQRVPRVDGLRDAPDGKLPVPVALKTSQ